MLHSFPPRPTLFALHLSRPYCFLQSALSSSVPKLQRLLLPHLSTSINTDDPIRLRARSLHRLAYTLIFPFLLHPVWFTNTLFSPLHPVWFTNILSLSVLSSVPHHTLPSQNFNFYCPLTLQQVLYKRSSTFIMSESNQRASRRVFLREYQTAQFRSYGHASNAADAGEGSSSSANTFNQPNEGPPDPVPILLKENQGAFPKVENSYRVTNYHNANRK